MSHIQLQRAFTCHPNPVNPMHLHIQRKPCAVRLRDHLTMPWQMTRRPSPKSRMTPLSCLISYIQWVGIRFCAEILSVLRVVQTLGYTHMLPINMLQCGDPTVMFVGL